MGDLLIKMIIEHCRKNKAWLKIGIAPVQFGWERTISRCRRREVPLFDSLQEKTKIVGRKAPQANSYLYFI